MFGVVLGRDATSALDFVVLMRNLSKCQILGVEGHFTHEPRAVTMKV
jgi:hypothetical protein